MERIQLSPVVLGESPARTDDTLAFDSVESRSSEGWKPVVIELS
jgi:hypothetical protein